ncbi:MAG: spore maturation protein [Clostridia bacterium]|nr:spore maturation protein [Clostridia bacterium]
MIYVLPVIIIFIVAYGIIRRVPVYDSFVSGAKKAFPLVVDVFPYLLAVIIMCEVFEKSGLSAMLIDLLTPFFGFFGIPKEIVPLVLIKPASGSGSLAVLQQLIDKYGADGYISRTACVVFGSSETTFYVGAVYFSSCKNKRFTKAIIISLVSFFISTVFACFICKII